METVTENSATPPLLEPELIGAVLAFARKQTCAVGDRLIGTGGPSECFYYVEKGLFEVSYLAQKTPIVVAMIGEGSFIGEIGFFDRQSRTRNILALKEARLSVFDHEVLDRMQTADADLYSRFLVYILRSVCSRFRQILTDRGPLTAYAALLSTGKEHFQGLQSLPADLLGSSIWQRISHFLEEFRAGMFAVAYKLQQDRDKAISPELAAQGEAILDRVKYAVREFGPVIDATGAVDLMWGYIFKEVFPYFMRSHFTERAYYKPKGYSGDFLMIEWIYQNQAHGDGKLGRLIDGWMLQRVPARAVRYRRRLLTQLLDRYCREHLALADEVRIMNLACGPARELFDVITTQTYGHQIKAVCIDIDDEALQYADEHVNTIKDKNAVRFMRENVIKWALGRVKHDFGPQHIIYSSGLCDYLDRRLVSALIEKSYHQLSKGGILIIGNFSPVNPDRYFMDHVLYWRLIHRSPEELRQIFAETSFGDQLEIVAEDEGVNLFAVARRAR